MFPKSSSQCPRFIHALALFAALFAALPAAAETATVRDGRDGQLSASASLMFRIVILDGIGPKSFVQAEQQVVRSRLLRSEQVEDGRRVVTLAKP